MVGTPAVAPTAARPEPLVSLPNAFATARPPVAAPAQPILALASGFSLPPQAAQPAATAPPPAAPPPDATAGAKAAAASGGVAGDEDRDSTEELLRADGPSTGQAVLFPFAPIEVEE